FMWLTLSVLRTVVTDRELHAHCGWWGRRVPLERIRSLRLAQQHKRVRIGTRFENRMWTTSFLLHTGDYIEVIFTDDKGKERRLQLTPRDPRAVVDAVNKARTRRIAVAEEGGEA